CDIKLGPEGALYIADFYNRIIGHYEVPLNHPGRDRTSGRIWRIVYRGEDGKVPPPKPPRADWTKATIRELIQDLAHPNLTVRRTATQQLVGGGREAAGALGEGSPPNRPGKADDVVAEAHALWVMERLGSLRDRDLLQAARAASEADRIHAMRIM